MALAVLRQWIKKATFDSGADLAAGGLLSPDQTTAFLKVLIEAATLTPLCRQESSRATKFGAGRCLRGESSGQDPATLGKLGGRRPGFSPGRPTGARRVPGTLPAPSRRVRGPGPGSAAEYPPALPRPPGSLERTGVRHGF